jgi:hypothetical protein
MPDSCPKRSVRAPHAPQALSRSTVDERRCDHPSLVVLAVLGFAFGRRWFILVVFCLPVVLWWIWAAANNGGPDDDPPDAPPPAPRRRERFIPRRRRGCGGRAPPGDSPSRDSFRPPSQQTVRFRVGLIRRASTYRQPVLGATTTPRMLAEHLPALPPFVAGRQRAPVLV